LAPHSVRIYERVLPIRKERSIELEFPPAKNALDLAANLQCILNAVGEGRITPGEAQILTEVLRSQAHLFEAADVERRLLALEERGSEVRAFRQQLDGQVQAFSAEYRKVLELTHAKRADEKAT